MSTKSRFALLADDLLRMIDNDYPGDTPTLIEAAAALRSLLDGGEACDAAWRRWAGWKPHDTAAPGVSATPGEHFRAGWNAALASQAIAAARATHPRHPCPPDGVCTIGDDKVCVTCGTCFATSCESVNACAECIERCRRKHQLETWFEQAGAIASVEPNNRDAETETMLAYSPESLSIPAAKDLSPAEGSDEPGVSSWLVTPERVAALADALGSEWDGRPGHGDREVVREMLAGARGAVARS